MSSRVIFDDGFARQLKQLRAVCTSDKEVIRRLKGIYGGDDEYIRCKIEEAEKPENSWLAINSKPRSKAAQGFDALFNL